LKLAEFYGGIEKKAFLKFVCQALALGFREKWSYSESDA